MKHLDRHKTRIGAERKQAVEYLAWAREARGKCRTSSDKVALLDTLLRLTDGLGGKHGGKQA